MKRWDWGVGNGEWGIGIGVGIGIGIENQEPSADSRYGNQLSAIRLQLSEFAYYFFK